MVVQEEERVLEEWMRAERVLRQLPRDAPERSEMEDEIAKLRSLFHQQPRDPKERTEPDRPDDQGA